jgi:hypothetical protein
LADKFDSDKAFEKVLVSSLEAELMPQSGHCPHSGTLSAYYESKLTDSEARDCERHVSSCATCQKQLAALVRIEQPTESEASPDETDGEPRWSWTWTASAALAATAVLAIVVTYRFLPLMEEASRLAVEQPSKPAELSQASPTAAPPPAVSEENSADRAASEPTQAAARLPEPVVEPTAPPATQAPSAAAEPATPAPSTEAAAPVMGQLAHRAPTAEVQPFLAKKSSNREAPATVAPARPRPSATAAAAPVARAKEMERAAAATSRDDSRDAGQGVIVVARSNPDVLWRLDGGRIERSDDGGTSWQSQTSGVTVDLIAGSAPSPEVCWVVGRGGTVLRTGDGRRWQKASSPTKEDLVKVTAYGAAEATVTSASGQRFGTGDGGKTWSVR